MADQMVDMAYSKAETKEMKGEAVCSPGGDAAKFPWGLCIRLEQAELDKLGMRQLPGVDQEVHIVAVGVVTGVNSNQRTGDKPQTSVAIQITGLQVVVEMAQPGEAKETMADENKESAQRGGNVLSNTTRSKP